MDAEKGEGVELRKRYNISGFPTTVYVNPDGTEIDRLVGYAPPDEFLAISQDYRANKNTLDDFLTRLQSDPENPELHYQVGQKYVERGQNEDGARHFNNILEITAEDAHEFVPRARFGLIDMKVTAARRAESDSVRTSLYQAATDQLKDFIQSYPDHELIEKAYYSLIRCYQRQEKTEDVVTSYRQAVQALPDNAGLHNGFAWFLAEQDLALDEALAIGQKAVKLDPENPQILDTLAEVHYKRGEFDQAIDVILKAIEFDDDDEYLQEQLTKFKTARDGGQTDASVE